MSTAEWTVGAPDNYAWTPAESAQIGKAVQAFQAALPNANGNLYHFVKIENLTILDASQLVDWPQPDQP